MGSIKSIQETISVIAGGWCSPLYRSACEYLIDHRDKLTYRVFICIPGEWENKDPTWDKVRQNSNSRCRCGKERMILPGKTRKFEASDIGELTISPGMRVFLKPIGGSLESTFAELWINIEGTEGIAILQDPFASIVLTPDFLSSPGYSFAQLEEYIQKYNPRENPGRIVMVCHNSPVFQFRRVDPEKKTVTILLDRDVEVFSQDHDD